MSHTVPTRRSSDILEVLLVDGTVLSMMNKGLKNNTGLDLKHLFIGTEGTLGVITRVVLRLFPKPERRYSALAAVDDLGHVLEILKQARASLPELSSFEVMWRDYLVAAGRSEEHTSELQSLMRISYAVFCLKKKLTHYSILK